MAAVASVASEPEPEVSLLETNLLGHVIAVRPYCHTDHYWQVYFDINEAMVRVAKEAGWPAPTPCVGVSRPEVFPFTAPTSCAASRFWP